MTEETDGPEQSSGPGLPPSPGSAHAPLLNASSAWRFILGLEPGSVEQGNVARLPLYPPGHDLADSDPGGGRTGSGSDPVLEVDYAGSWRTDARMSDGAAQILDMYLPIRIPRRLVVGQLGQSLDGRIATESGHSHYINGPDDIRRLHALRALVDAVVVGPGTVASDNPRLTVREVEGPNPVRVVLDPRGTLPADRNVFRDGGPPVIWIRAEGAAREDHRGVETVELPLDDALGGFHPGQVLRALADRGLHRVLVEGGGRTVSAFLEHRLLDRLHVSVAPLILGSGRPGITLPVIETLDEGLRPAVRHFRLGTDLLFDLDLRPG